MIYGVIGLLGALSVGYGIFLGKDAWHNRTRLEPGTRFGFNVFVGFLTDFLDTLGIGSFAPTTALLRGFKQVKDRLLPGTLNAGHALPAVLEAIIFMTVIKVEIITLVTMVAASVIGAIWGAGIVARLPEKTIRLVMGIALLITAFLMICRHLGFIEALGTGDAIGLTGSKLILAVAGNLVLGALMTAGVGLYAPCMALVYMLGMSPRVAFPIMAGSCAFLMPPAAIKFIKAGAINRKAVLGITTGGLAGVLIAAYIIKSLPLNTLTWLVIGVVFITAISLIRAALLKKNKKIVDNSSKIL
jgi:uncharacterized membrane protein YfcA